MELSDFTAYFEDHHSRFLEEWKDFLRIPSLSSDSAYITEAKRCGDWVERHLRGIGFQTEILETEGPPVVYAFHPGFGEPGSSPSVVYYGHYDVQPADPLEEWISDPFEPVIRNGRLYARGAQDNKGQLMYVFKALECLIAHQALKCPVKICIEGEEESMSINLNRKLPEWAEKFSADVLMSCDTEAPAPGVPLVTVGLRGWAAATVTLYGPNVDMHSGLHGGVCPNPANALAKLLATLHDDTGKVAVKDFYDDVLEPTEQEQAMLSANNVEDENYKSTWGVYPHGGERGRGCAERAGRRPTIDVNGMYSGHTGPGVKTIIPAKAVAKMTMRLVANQDPENVIKAVKKHLEENCPENLRLELSDLISDGAALMVDPECPEVLQAREVLQEVCGRKAEVGWSGGSIPILARFFQLVGCRPVLVGFGLPEDSIHSPNESFRLDQFRLGFLFVARFLSTLRRSV